MAAMIPARLRSDSTINTINTPGYPTVPDNTPVIASTMTSPRATADQKIDVTSLIEQLQLAERDDPGRFWENDSLVPHNTPAIRSLSHTPSRDASAFSPLEFDDYLSELPSCCFQYTRARASSASSSCRFGDEECGSPVKAWDRPVSATHMQDTSVPGTDTEILRDHSLYTTTLGGSIVSPVLSKSNGVSASGPHRVSTSSVLTNGATEIESDLRCALVSLGALANEDHAQNPQRSVQQHFQDRFCRVLKSRSDTATALDAIVGDNEPRLQLISSSDQSSIADLIGEVRELQETNDALTTRINAVEIQQP